MATMVNFYESYVDKSARERAELIYKVALTIKEAAEYSNIGINKLESLLRSPRCPFVLYVGKKKLVKRKEFEKMKQHSKKPLISVQCTALI